MISSTQVLFAFFLIGGNLIQLYFVVCMLFYLFLSFIGAVVYKNGEDEKDRKGSDGYRFAVVIPAHNEERVIGNLIESLLLQDYPKGNYDIYVICDNCTDKTSAIAKGYGVEVIAHYNNLPSNKAKALNYGIQHILTTKGDYYDAFCFFDADSLAHPDFLKYISYYLSKGYVVVQAQQLPKNPNDSFITKIISVGQYITNRFFQKPKMILGLSATLHGKGICFKTDLVKKYRWDESCLTEDLEMQMRLINDGVFIAWGEKSIVYDEEPITLRQYFKRSVRWTRGSLYVAKKHAFALLKRAIGELDPCSFEAFIYSVGVYRVFMVVFASLALYYTHNHFNLLIWLFNLFPYDGFIKLFLLFIPLIILPFVIWFERSIAFDMIVAYYMQPFLSIFRVPIFIVGLFKPGDIWERVEHTSSIRIGDIVKKEVL